MKSYWILGLACTLAGPAPQASQSHRSALVVVDAGGSSVEFLDPITLAKSARVRVGVGPGEVAVSADGRTAYLPLRGAGDPGRNAPPGHQVAAIDLGTRKVARMIELRPHVAPGGIAIDRQGMLWVTCQGEGSLLVIDPRRQGQGGAIAAVPLGLKGEARVVASHDGSKVYAACGGTPILSVVDATSRHLIREIRLSHPADALAMTPDGRRLYVASASRRSLMVVNTSTDRLEREHPLDEAPGRLFVAPGGRDLMVAHPESGTVEVFEAATMRRRGVVRVGQGPAAMAASADGRQAYVANVGDGTVSLLDLENLRVLRTSQAGKPPAAMVVLGE